MVGQFLNGEALANVLVDVLDDLMGHRVLAQRREQWKPKPMKYKRGAIRLFSEHAASPMKGAYLEFDE